MQALQHTQDSNTPATLCLVGTCGYAVDHDRVILSIEQIASHRDSHSISGTLSVELWAHKQPYAGGGFSGVALAGTSIGELWDQRFLSDCRYDLLFHEPPAGTWFLTLMLREWTEAGYVTRDHVNFALPYTVPASPAVEHGVADNVINVNFSNSADLAVMRAPAKPVGKPELAGDSTDNGRTPRAISLNDAGLQQIAAVKGISRKLAADLVASRPFKSFEDVLKVKGIGAALLRKIRELFTL